MLSDIYHIFMILLIIGSSWTFSPPVCCLLIPEFLLFQDHCHYILCYLGGMHHLCMCVYIKYVCICNDNHSYFHEHDNIHLVMCDIQHEIRPNLLVCHNLADLENGRAKLPAKILAQKQVRNFFQHADLFSGMLQFVQLSCEENQSNVL